MSQLPLFETEPNFTDADYRMMRTGMVSPMGTGPAGETCGSCRFIVRNSSGGVSTFHCDMMRPAVGHVKPRFPACRHWQTAVIPESISNRNEVHRARRDQSERQRKEVYDLIKSRSERGLTIDEAAVLMSVFPNQISGRFTELRKAGLIVEKSEKRKTRSGRLAVVWVAN